MVLGCQLGNTVGLHAGCAEGYRASWLVGLEASDAVELLVALR
eukprot:gene14477-16909_t